MTPPRTRTAARVVPDRGDKRDAIMRAALALFVERGFHGTTVPEIAERAGVGAGTIYRYFTSKETLVNELYRHHKQLLLAWLLHEFPHDRAAREQFSVLWRKMAQFADEDPLAFAFLELHNHGGYLDPDSKALEVRITEFGVAFVTAAQRRGEIRAEHPAILIGIVLGALIGLVSKSQHCGLALTREHWETAEQCVWEAIRR